jgi:cysteine dioxygenase
MEKLIHALDVLKDKEINPPEALKAITATDRKELEYEKYLDGYDLTVYNRIKIVDSPMQVYLMTWPPQFLLPIHQQKNFWGYVMPLKGILAETVYGYAARKRKVFLHPTKTHKPGEIIYEPYNVIHKLQNTSPLEPTITIHINYPPYYDFNGTMIFDAQNRRLAVLNEKAKSLSWDLPADHYKKVMEDAYDVEKLW